MTAKAHDIIGEFARVEGLKEAIEDLAKAVGGFRSNWIEVTRTHKATLSDGSVWPVSISLAIGERDEGDEA